MIRPVTSDEIWKASSESWRRYHNNESDRLFQRPLGDGREVCLLVMGFGNLRLTLGPEGSDFWDLGFCYHDATEAWRNALGWDGHDDPEGWYRDLVKHRRRPDGDPEREYIEP